MISIYPTPGIFTNINFPFSPVSPQRFSELASYVTAHTWSPIIYRENVRQERNFICAWLISLDFDNTVEQVMTLSQAVNNVFCDMRHIIGTTKNHQLPKVTENATYPPADRFRVILQLPERVTSAEEYLYTFNKSIAHYDADRGAGGLSRLFHPCREIVSIQDGYFEDYYQESEQEKERKKTMIEIRKREIAAYRLLGKDPPFIRYILSSAATLNRNTFLYPAIRYYAELGMSAEQIEEIISNSNTYIKNINDRQWIKGIVSSIKSAVKNHGVSNG